MASLSDVRAKGRFLVTDILLALCLDRAQIQFISIKKIKIEGPEHLLTTHLPTSNNMSFLPYPSLPPQSGRRMCITLN